MYFIKTSYDDIGHHRALAKNPLLAQACNYCQHFANTVLICYKSLSKAYIGFSSSDSELLFKKAILEIKNKNAACKIYLI